MGENQNVENAFWSVLIQFLNQVHSDLYRQKRIKETYHLLENCILSTCTSPKQNLKQFFYTLYITIKMHLTN